MAFDPFKLLFKRSARSEAVRPGNSADQRETLHRLQVGSFGLGAMILLVGLANIIMDSVKDTQASAVPEAAPTVVVSQAPAPVRDPLADAGVVPDLPAEPEATGTAPSGAPPAAGQSGNASPSPRP